MISISWGFRWNLVADLSHFLWGMFGNTHFCHDESWCSPCDDHLRHPEIVVPFWPSFLQHVWYIHRTSIGFKCLIPSTSILSPFFFWFLAGLGSMKGWRRWRSSWHFPFMAQHGRCGVWERGRKGDSHRLTPNSGNIPENMTVCSKGMTMDDRHGHIGQEKISKITCLDEFWAVNLGLQPTNYADWSCKHGDGTWAWSWYRGRPRSMWMFIAITLNEHGGSAPSGMTFFETIEVILLFGCKNNGF